MAGMMCEQGQRVWAKKKKKEQWLPTTVSEASSSSVTFSSVYGESFSLPRPELTQDNVMPMHQTSIDGVEDMATLGDLHEAAILYNIQQRYSQDLIYSFIGSIVSAVNPYKTIEGVYSQETMNMYMDRQIGDLPPHVFAIANEVYVSMWRMRQNQCVLISGESGAGKTESTKFILAFLSAMSQKAMGNTQANLSVEKAIMESSPILEAFGNAKTVYNNNSSRFGKFIRLNFIESGNVEGGRINDYLLEKNRVVRQNPQERNFHIFYGMLAGTTKEEKENLQLMEPEKFYYLNQSGCVSDPSINDVRDFQNVRNAFEVMALRPEQVQDILGILAGILHLGNITFVSAAGAQIANKSYLDAAARLLSLDSYRLGDALTKKFMVLRGEEITTPLTKEQAEDSRDSTSMRLYANLFRWVLEKINIRIRGGEEKFAFVGVLDIFGFENFQVNRFEQFNINFANEKLQEYFNKHIFSLEQHEYNKEGINWADIEWVDNVECLDLIEMRLGVLDLLDEESRFPKGTDQSLLEKLHNAHKANAFYVKPKVNNGKFGIKHYAGEVFYDVIGLLEKNRDTFRDDVLKVLKESRSDFVYDLFEHMSVSDSGGGRKTTTMGKRGGKPSRKKATVSSQFKDSLHSLVTTLGQANPYFVRCIKPNNKKKRDMFQPQTVMNQLKYSGMMETVRIRRSGYPVRRIFDDFLFRYSVLGRMVGTIEDPKMKCIAILEKNPEIPGKKDWQPGHTKIFYRENLERHLERQRMKELRAVCVIIYGVIKTVVTRRRYLKTKLKIVQVQKMIRRFIYLRRFIKIKNAAIVMQKFERGRQARHLYAVLLEEKRIEEERRREEERRKEEERLRELERQQKELERLEREKKEQEASEMRRKLEEEERLRQEEEEARLRAEEKEERRAEEERQAELVKVKELEEEHRRLVEQRERELKEAEAARIKAEREAEAARAAALEAEKEENLQEQTQDAFAVISDLDSALKAFQGALGLDTDLESDQEEDEYELEGEGPNDVEFYEEYRVSQDLEESSDPHSNKFRAEGQLMNYEEEPSFEGYLQVKGNKRGGASWKRRWAIVKDDVLMFFEMKQDAIKQGWLQKKSSGVGTLGRRNWKKRYFALRGKTLFYYSESDLSIAKPNGAIDLNDVIHIEEDSGSVFGIVTSERTYHLTADDGNDKREWCELIRRVKGMPEAKVQSILAQEVDSRKALMSIDVELIDSVSAIQDDKKTNSFTLYTANRIYELMADNSAEMHMWIGALSPKKFSQRDDAACLYKGWLIKEGLVRRKRFFVLTENNQLRYYKSEDTRQPVAGNIHLNCLCAVDVCDESEVQETGVFTFKLHARKSTITLSAKSADEVNEWLVALQDVIDGCPAIQTISERVILEIIKNSRFPDWDLIYNRYKILAHSPNPIKGPLLALPYGKPPLPKEKDVLYSTRHQEAIKIYNALLSQESVADPIKQVQDILQKCFDIEDLQSEVFTQCIKQTAGLPKEEVDTPGALSYWQTLACLCCTFLPERAIKRYLMMHINKTIEKYPESEMAKFAGYCLTSLQRTKKRDYVPSRNEVIASLGRRDLNTIVHCYGGGQCNININPSTTAGEVVQKLCLGLQMNNGHNNKFSLFEVKGNVSRVIDDRTILVDILGKFEMSHTASMKDLSSGIPERWKLFFKLFCFINPQNVPSDNIESAFMYEQFCDDVVMGGFPASHERLLKFAALRLQFLEGDCISGTTIDNITEVYPLSRIMAEVGTQKDLYGPGNLQETYYAKTIGKKGIGTISKKFRAPEITEADRTKAAIEVLKNTYKGNVMEWWKRLQGVSVSQAQHNYMSLLTECPAYASTFFEAEYIPKDQRFPRNLWLVINRVGVQVYQRGAVAPIQRYSYETIVSFGAPASNVYRLVVEGQVPISLQTSMVAEIAKLMTAYIRYVV